jgi:metal-dependent amidase/aminoacylase/carboxypeptidase family protein
MIEMNKELSTILDEKINRLFPSLVDIRRQLHMYPELSNKEFETTKRINGWLKEFGIRQIPTSLKTGTAAEVAGKEQGPTIALRADIDALPIQEASKLLIFHFVQKLMGSAICAGMMFTQRLP